MTDSRNHRVHLVAGGFPPGSSAGHDHDYVRLRLLELLYECGKRGSVANDFADVDKWLAVSGLLVTYTAGPYPNDAQTDAIEAWAQRRRPLVGTPRDERRWSRTRRGCARATVREGQAPRPPWATAS